MTSVVASAQSPIWNQPSDLSNRRGTSPNRRHDGAILVTRSASSNELTNLSHTNLTMSVHPLRRTLSENTIISLSPHAWAGQDQSGNGLEHEMQDGSDAARRKTVESVSQPQVGDSQLAPDTPIPLDDDILDMRKTDGSWPLPIEGKRRSMSRSLSRLARRSWIPSSRSPSPSPVKSMRTETESLRSGNSSCTSMPSSSSNLNAQESYRAPRRPSKGQRRPGSTLGNKCVPESTIPSVPSIPKSFSTDKLFIVRSQATERSFPVSTSASVERLQNAGMEGSRKRDELWSAFRTLDGEFQKHVSSVLVRSSVIDTLAADR